MSEFSKQFCDKYDPQTPYDFDLDELYAQLQPGQSAPVICEGFGFTHIAKSDDGTRQVVFTNWAEEGDDYKFVNYDDLTDQTHRKLQWS